MSKKLLWIIVLTAATVLLGAGFSGTWIEKRALAQPGDENTTGSRTVTAAASSNINYQGRVTNASGTPLSGTYPMRFQLYDASASGNLLWDSGIINAAVTNGLFNVQLGVDANDFNGQALWLRLYVDGEWLTPRQEILPAPYALSLRPGADVSGEPEVWNDAILDVELTGTWPGARAGGFHAPSTGTALFADASGGAGLYSSSDDSYAVWGTSVNSWGGLFTSNNGYGLRVHTNGADIYDHGAYITSQGGYGVYAQSSSNMAIRGEAGNVSGLNYPLGPVGVVGIGTSRGVYGSSGNGSGVYGSSDGNYGVWGQSETYRGVTGRTDRPDNNYGLYTPDNLFSLNINLVGAIMQVVQNGSSETIVPGDVVVFSGIGEALFDGGLPTIQVSHTTQANDSAVAGVVYSRFNIDAIDPAQDQPDRARAAADMEITLAGPVLPGEYMLLVVHGPAEVNVRSINGDIQPGDLLATSGTTGLAGLATERTVNDGATAVPSTIFGKALEALEDNQESIFVFVTLN